MQERTIKSKKIYKGRIISVRDDTVRMATGRVTSREVVEHPGAVGVIALTSKSEIILVRQYRKPVEQVMLEIPAGLFNKGENLAAAAKRELEEETGYKAGKIKKVFSAFMSPGYSTERFHYFLTKDLKKTSQRYEEDEHIKVVKLPLLKAWHMVKSGQIKDNKTIVGIAIAKWMS
ncbi:NUDIX hydrolase [Candidatus Saganbacteria bacterium]|nr:NUDIX hydrolase [Candidatus Saganbacteria bacterium]